MQQQWRVATAERRGEAGRVRSGRTRHGQQERIVERKSDACDGDAEDETGLARSQEGVRGADRERWVREMSSPWNFGLRGRAGIRGLPVDVELVDEAEGWEWAIRNVMLRWLRPMLENTEGSPKRELAGGKGEPKDPAIGAPEPGVGRPCQGCGLQKTTGKGIRVRPSAC